MDDVGNGRIETGNSILDRTPGYPGPEPDGYPVPKISESPSTVTIGAFFKSYQNLTGRVW